MKNKSVTIVDYGVGNLYSVQRAFEVCGANNICISSTPDEILTAERLVLPGVGAFADGMLGLRARGLDIALRKFADSGRPLLGICLGMQLFATSSREFGMNSGLDLISGQVEPIPSSGTNGEPLKTPYIGWSSLDRVDFPTWDETVLASLTPERCIYLVHSFHFIPDDPSNVLATYQYGGRNITAAIRKENITGLQFHPEKSGQVGLHIINDFMNCA